MAIINGYANSYANRGQPLEHFIIQANAYYRHRQVAVIEKMPTEWIPLRNNTGRIISAKVEHKSAVDFFGIYKGLAVAFDAKNTNSDKIEFKRVEDHQAAILDDWQALGGITFIFVGWQMKRFFVVPWSYWRECLTVYKAKKKPASIKIADFRPEWEVREGGPYILDYLGVAERLGLSS
ncbi:MAG: Holliday junction resolvase RecU [Sporomusaceae bacterium]|nr:Holliday junction resolvase RecU [Sporomusaceae bacterium]